MNRSILFWALLLCGNSLHAMDGLQRHHEPSQVLTDSQEKPRPEVDTESEQSKTSQITVAPAMQEAAPTGFFSRIKTSAQHACQAITNAKASGKISQAFFKGASHLYSATATVARHYAQSVDLRKAVVAPDEHSHEPAYVQPSVHDFEQEALQNRHQKTHEALEQFLGQKIAPEDMPSIGGCFSGGGCRAKLETIGWMSGAEKIEFLGAMKALSGLSGSTWALNPWVASGLPITQFKEKVIQTLAKSLIEHVKSMDEKDLKDLMLMLARKYYNHQHIGPVDFFGAVLTHLFLKGHVPHPHQFRLSELSEAMKKGDHPLIISTAVSSSLGTHRPSFEFSPFAAGSFEVTSFVPMWGFGRPFNGAGESEKIIPKNLFAGECALIEGAARRLMPSYEAPQKDCSQIEDADEVCYYGHELPLGFLMGMWGSAFAVDMYTVLFALYHRLVPESFCTQDTQSMRATIDVIKNLLAPALVRVGEVLKVIPKGANEKIELLVKDEHYGAAKIANFTFKQGGHFSEHRTLSFVDGGFEIVERDHLNIAIMPLLHRAMNLICICDSSMDLKGAPSLRAAERRARNLRLKFPKIDYKGIETRSASMFVDEHDLEAPIIVYMPGIANPSYGEYDPALDPATNTLNFTYSKEKSEALVGLIEHNVLESKELLRAACIKAIERKRLLRLRNASRNWIPDFRAFKPGDEWASL